MSKKPAKSERDVDLPDWADEVTPTDEVMRKFYAPTGSFKPGPILVQHPATQEDAAPAAAPAEAREEAPPAHEFETQEIPAPENVPFVEPPDETGLTTDREKEQETSLPPTVSPPESSFAERDLPPAPSSPLPKASRGAAPLPQSLSFDEFARKWRRYLYPGQLAVMRTLFDLTIDLGTTECFTRYSEIAAATKMTRRNCINVMNSLVERGFVERLEVRNDSTGKGIKLRVHTDPLP
jgi:hypothetical protein